MCFGVLVVKANSFSRSVMLANAFPPTQAHSGVGTNSRPEDHVAPQNQCAGTAVGAAAASPASAAKV